MRAASSRLPGAAQLWNRLTGSRRRRALRDIGTVAVGVWVSRVIAVLAIPVIARLFDPDHFGQAAFLVTLAAALGTGVSLRYSEAIILPAGHGEARQLSRLSWMLLVASVPLVGLIGLFWPASSLPAWLAAYDGWWLILAGLVALQGAQAILHSWVLRRARFGWLAAGDVVDGGVSSLGRIGWGFAFGSSVTGLVVPVVVGLGLHTLTCLGGARERVATAGADDRDRADAASLRSSPDPTAAGDADLPSLRATAARYAHFPMYGLPSTMMRALSERMPLLVLGALFAPAVAGLYAAADRLMRLPVQSITRAIRKVFAQRAAVRQQQGRSLLPLLALATGGLALVGAPPFGLLAIYGSDLLPVVLGERWAAAGDFAQAIALWGYSLFLLGPATALLMVLEKQRQALFVNTARVALFALVAGAAVHWELGALRAVQCFAAAGAVSNVGMIGLAFYLAMPGRSPGKFDPVRPAAGAADDDHGATGQ